VNHGNAMPHGISQQVERKTLSTLMRVTIASIPPQHATTHAMTATPAAAEMRNSLSRRQVTALTSFLFRQRPENNQYIPISDGDMGQTACCSEFVSLPYKNDHSFLCRFCVRYRTPQRERIIASVGDLFYQSSTYQLGIVRQKLRAPVEVLSGEQAFLAIFDSIQVKTAVSARKAAKLILRRAHTGGRRP
jgi:hypothetical protein